MEDYEKSKKAEQRQIADVARARASEFLDRLIAELEKRGHTVRRPKADAPRDFSERERGLRIDTVDGENVSFGFKLQREGYTYRTYTGRLRCIMESHPRKNYAEPKKGFDLEKTITRILDRVFDEQSYRKNYEKKQELADAKKATLKRTCELLGVEDHYGTIGGGVSFTEGDADHVKVTLMMTPEEFKEFIKSRSAKFEE